MLFTQYKSMSYKNNPLDDKPGWISKPEDELLGFSWKGGSEIYTTGVVMWSDIFLYEIEKPGKPTEKLAIVFFDTQGLFDSRTSSEDSSRIFGLITLMSSLQIFNLNDVIQENQLEYLQMATEYGQYHASNNSNNKNKPFQNILFLIRDWVHISDHPYGFSGGQDYIKELLEVKQNQNPALRMMRENIKSSFDNINCFLMPHPGSQIITPRYNGSFVLMDKKFREQLVELVEHLLKPKNLVKKKILGESVNSQQFGEYMKTFFKIFQSLETPGVPSIYTATLNTKNLLAHQ